MEFDTVLIGNDLVIFTKLKWMPSLDEANTFVSNISKINVLILKVIRTMLLFVTRTRFDST